MANAVGAGDPLEDPPRFIRLYGLTRDRIQSRYHWRDSDLHSLSYGRFLSLCEHIGEYEFYDDRRNQRVLAPLMYITHMQNAEKPVSYERYFRDIGLEESTSDYAYRMLSAKQSMADQQLGQEARKKAREALADDAGVQKSGLDSDDWGDWTANDLDAVIEAEAGRTYAESEYRD